MFAEARRCAGLGPLFGPDPANPRVTLVGCWVLYRRGALRGPRRWVFSGNAV